jgi:hypothetical protein
MPTGNQNIEGSLLSPNIGNYYIGKGILSIKLLGETAYTDCGNVPQFEFQSKVTSLDHFSSRQGVRVKDFTAVVEVAGNLTMQLEELTARNMGFALLGLPTGGPSPTPDTIEIFSSPIIYGAVKFTGTNIIGPIYTITFPLVKLSPSKALSLIGNSWGTIDLEGDVLYDTVLKSFGTASVTLPNSPSSVLG